MSERRCVIKFSFEGSAFEGYARQPTGSTVEGELIQALQRARLIDGPGEANFASASRVDRGVSALGAAVAFDTDAPAERVLPSLNAQASGIVAHSIAEVTRGFDPRRQAEFRWYRYHFPRSDPERTMDASRMTEAAARFVGVHDFSAFARVEGRDPVREVLDISIQRMGDTLVLDVRGRSFLWNQVRRMASAIATVGEGAESPESIEDALRSGRGGPYPTAPAEDLILMDVGFADLDFRRLEDYPKSTLERARQGHRRSEALLRYHEYIMEILGVAFPRC